ncbi:unnamed protein product, partial [Mesorhabditis spiculigera]
MSASRSLAKTQEWACDVEPSDVDEMMMMGKGGPSQGGNSSQSTRIDYLCMDESIHEEQDLGEAEAQTTLKCTLRGEVGPKPEPHQRASNCLASRREQWSLELQGGCTAGPQIPINGIYRPCINASDDTAHETNGDKHESLTN